jgi:ribosomal-protein-alanine N-acetyltransferase
VFTKLETSRLILKNIDSTDSQFIYNQFSNDFINKYLFDAEPVGSIEDAEEIIQFYRLPEPRMQHRWILIIKDNDTKIGTCGFHCWDKKLNSCEIGYDLLEQYNGKGYMSEALDEIIRYAKENMYIKKIIANVYIDNEKSITLLKRKGFSRSGEIMYKYRNKEYNHFVYTLEYK